MSSSSSEPTPLYEVSTPVYSSNVDAPVPSAEQGPSKQMTGKDMTSNTLTEAQGSASETHSIATLSRKKPQTIDGVSEHGVNLYSASGEGLSRFNPRNLSSLKAFLSASGLVSRRSVARESARKVQKAQLRARTARAHSYTPTPPRKAKDQTMSPNAHGKIRASMPPRVPPSVQTSQADDDQSEADNNQPAYEQVAPQPVEQPSQPVRIHCGTDRSGRWFRRLLELGNSDFGDNASTAAGASTANTNFVLCFPPLTDARVPFVRQVESEEEHDAPGLVRSGSNAKSA